MIQTCRFEITQNLGFMLRRKCFGGFSLNNQHPFHQKIRRVFANERAIFIKHIDPMLLFHLQTGRL